MGAADGSPRARRRSTSQYDAWPGYLAERQRFYDAIASASNPIIYSGDSHNAWAGVHRRSASGSAGSSAAGGVIGNEFAGTVRPHSPDTPTRPLARSLAHSFARYSR